MAIESAADLAAFFDTTDTGGDAQAATFTPRNGAPIACAVIINVPEAAANVDFPGMREANLEILVRKSEIADPAGGRFSNIATLPGTYRVTETTLDVLGALFTCRIASTA